VGTASDQRLLMPRGRSPPPFIPRAQISELIDDLSTMMEQAHKGEDGDGDEEEEEKVKKPAGKKAAAKGKKAAPAAKKGKKAAEKKEESAADDEEEEDEDGDIVIDEKLLFEVSELSTMRTAWLKSSYWCRGR
jgi:hypothetical protein